MNLKYTILIYLILLIFIFFWKPEIFKLNIENKNRKILYLVFLIIIIAIISFYAKILSEWFL
jgi:hypothetical protein